jgi:hypothetical protein
MIREDDLGRARVALLQVEAHLNLGPTRGAGDDREVVAQPRDQ